LFITNNNNAINISGLHELVFDNNKLIVIISVVLIFSASIYFSLLSLLLFKSNLRIYLYKSSTFIKLYLIW